MKNYEEFYKSVKSKLESIKQHVFPRTTDKLIIIQPSRIFRANSFTVEFLEPFWMIHNFDTAINMIKSRFNMKDEEVLRTLDLLVDDLIHLLKNEISLVKNFETRDMTQQTTVLEYPIMAEIAVTDNCNNRCKFCFWGVGEVRKPTKDLPTDQIKKLIDIIWYQARAPSLHFTGGEPTLRRDLPELIRYAKNLGLSVIILTNGRRLKDLSFAKTLVDAGIKGAQISLEATNAALHDKLVGVKGAFEETIAGIQNMLSIPGVFKKFWVHTNTTITRWNIDNVLEMPYFLKDLGLQAFSMNLLIWSGNATYYKELGVSYTEIGEIATEIKKRAEEVGLSFHWYPPTSVCLFNPAVEGFGIKGCAAANGLLSIDAQGYILPCSSFPPEYRLGNLFEQSFEEIWFSEEAKKWRYRKHEFVPDVCKICRDFDVCGGACPLYWMNNPFKEKDLRMMRILHPPKMINVKLINDRREKGDL